ncbi:MAG TPA: SpoIIE family protein phosphatase [Rhodocyclaceae bacterium]|nr:SpoIIE family protein phosphatase [Rhodocyclaceae bacterium]
MSGDCCAAWEDENRVVMAVVDGLGHGIYAAQAAETAIRCIERVRSGSCAEIFAECDDQLRNTRGAALALAIVDRETKQLTLATIGNIRAVLIGATNELYLGGDRGIVGAGIQQLTPEEVPLHDGDLLLLYSDGLPEVLPWSSLRHAALNPQNLVDHLIDDWATGNDDASVLLYRHQPLSPK